MYEWRLARVHRVTDTVVSDRQYMQYCLHREVVFVCEHGSQYTLAEMADPRVAVPTWSAPSALGAISWFLTSGYKDIHQYSLKLQRNGSIVPAIHDRGKSRAVRTPDTKMESCPTFAKNQATSTRNIGAMASCTSSACILLPNNNPRWVDFSQRPLQQQIVAPGFLSVVVYGGLLDEMTKDSLGMELRVSLVYSYVWARENPHVIFRSRHLHRFSARMCSETHGTVWSDFTFFREGWSGVRTSGALSTVCQSC